MKLRRENCNKEGESRSREGAWIEICVRKIDESNRDVAPARERGLKYTLTAPDLQNLKVAPARERGLKYLLPILLRMVHTVAPARERGLK